MIQLFGAVMFAAVCAAYIFGLPTDTVLHGELSYRLLIGVFGAVFFVGSVATIAAAFASRKRAPA